MGLGKAVNLLTQHPEAFSGLLLTARRATDQSGPVMKRLAVMAMPYILTGIVSAGSSVMGVLFALNDRMYNLESDHKVSVKAIEGDLSVKAYQLTELSALMNEMKARISMLEGRQRDLEHGMSLLVPSSTAQKK